MRPDPITILSIRKVRKDYRGLRPLRIERLDMRDGETVALIGFDRLAAQVFVDLVTGASAPDDGDIQIFGQSTTAIPDGDAWLQSLDRFGILSDRAVLLEDMTVAQNLAMPFTLELDPIPDAIRVQVARLAADVGLDVADLPRRAGELGPAGRLRVRLARAVALDPRMLLAEHPNAALAAEDMPAFAADFSSLVARRGLASVTLTADRTFASAVAGQVLTLDPATGALEGASGWRRWFMQG
jgi:ABC-type transporter Mla maintaining outer membrane lipid asymmetry ATPase subunit MlaF